jgi:predicted phage gp36 major capsid-like protein
LKLSAEQTKQLLEISHKRDKLVQKEREEAKSLSGEEQEKSRAALRARRIQWESDACKEIEGVLTPPQLTALAEIKIAEQGGYVLQRPTTLELLGPSDEQKAAWKRLAAESQENGRKAFLERTDKALAILTPLQQQKLREKMEREGL